MFVLVLGAYQAFAACSYCDGHDCLEARTDIPKGKGSSGKWRDAETPKRDWMCTEVYDREITDTCQMCEREPVRFAHVMEHGTLTLDVGCICAAYMDGTLDEEASAQREAALRARPKKLENFMNETKWKESGGKGNLLYTIKKSDHNPLTRKVILIPGYGDTYAYRVSSYEGKTQVSSYPSEGFLASKEIAMRKAFDSIFPLRMGVK